MVGVVIGILVVALYSEYRFAKRLAALPDSEERVEELTRERDAATRLAGQLMQDLYRSNRKHLLIASTNPNWPEPHTCCGCVEKMRTHSLVILEPKS